MDYAERMASEDFAWVYHLLPRVLPIGWREVERVVDGAKYVTPMGGGVVDGGFVSRRIWSVILSGITEQDGRRWIHLSTAMPHRLPNWAELVEVRDIFLGRDKKCIQVIPPKSEHVNIHSYCLHLWHCVDGDPLPDFTWGTGSL